MNTNNMVIDNLILNCQKVGIGIKFLERAEGHYYSIKSCHGKWVDSVRNHNSKTEAAINLRNLIGKFL